MIKKTLEEDARDECGSDEFNDYISIIETDKVRLAVGELRKRVKQEQKENADIDNVSVACEHFLDMINEVLGFKED